LAVLRGIRFGTGPAVSIFSKNWNKNDANWNWVLGFFQNRIWNFGTRIRASLQLNCQFWSKNRTGTGTDF
jgi:hypothetical protein